MAMDQLPVVMFCGHALSRFAPLILIRFGHYAREDQNAKAKPLATQMGNGDLISGFIFAILPLLLLPWPVWWTLPVAMIIGVALLYYFRRWVGGYTGDCLGAVQQISEIFIYLTILAVL
jgi:adenosylcobinamide-GDP ribazoletransferase